MFYEKFAIAVTVCALAAAVLDASRRNWNSEVREPFHYTFSNQNTIDIDNIDGAIEVTGDNGSTIRVDGERILRAEDQRALDRAKREVTLDVNQKDGIAQLYVNGPFRHNNSNGDHGFHVRDDDYEATYNFTGRVPRDTALELRTVNGEVSARDTLGKFDVHGVNGGISMTSIAGSGTLRTVNGRIDASFTRIPTARTDFQTVNGEIIAAFPSNLSADVHVHTLNGEAWTDFESTAQLPPTSAASGFRNGRFPNARFTWRPNAGGTIRIGSGGPELDFQTLNGSIQIKKETR
jgi:hypothetical protein